MKVSHVVIFQNEVQDRSRLMNWNNKAQNILKLLVGNVRDMLAHVATGPTMLADFQPASHVADVVTGLVVGSWFGATT